MLIAHRFTTSIMDGSKLNLTSLRDKISTKLAKKEEPAKKSEGKKGKKNDEKRNERKGQDRKTNIKPKADRDVPKQTPRAPRVDEEMRREALALGATEDDLALLEGVDDGEGSEQEFDAEDTVDATLTSELSSFILGIGMDLAREEEVPELTEDEEEPEEEPEEAAEKEEAKADSEAEAVSGAASEAEREAEADSDSEIEAAASDSDSDSDAESASATVQPAAVTATVATAAATADPTASVNSSKLLIPNRTDWYNNPYDTLYEPQKCDRFMLERLSERAQKTLEAENKTYLAEFTANSLQKKFLSQILADGTLNDKISALTLLVQESPLHNVKALDTLVGYCEKKLRTAAMQSVHALKDLLISGVLPDRKLVAFPNQRLHKDLPLEVLARFWFEHHLKQQYFKLVGVLETLLHDPIVHVRMHAVGHVFDLLRAKPEQEANLLRLGVNKLGDVDNKVAAKASYQILQVEQQHPAMKRVVTDAVTDIVMRPTSDHHAQYYAVLTLNQTILTRREDELANALVKTYFTLFEKVLLAGSKTAAAAPLGTPAAGRKALGRLNYKKGKRGGRLVKAAAKTETELVEERSTRLFLALLTGLNRAFPFALLAPQACEQHLETLYRITHSTNFNTLVQALVLIHHVVTQQRLDAGRYFRTLYELLLDARLVTLLKQGIYLNLLYKLLKGDANVPRVLAFVKRILQVCLHWLNVGAVAGMLYLLMELGKAVPQIRDLTIEPASRPEEEVVGDAADATAAYDSKKRDPAFAHAEHLLLWELGHFLHHFHPTVAIYAQLLVDGTPQPKPDLGLYTLLHFLDRFVYRNAKQKTTTKGLSIMQPLGGAHTGSLLVRATNVDTRELPANAEDWLARRAKDIKPDEKFFHLYFTSKQNKIRKQGEKEVEETEEMEDGDVWDALVKSRPEVEEGSDDEGFSFDEEDFSEEEEESEEAEEAQEAEEAEESEEAEEAATAADDAGSDAFSDDADDADDASASDSDIFGINSDEYDSDAAPAAKKRKAEADKADANDKKKLKALPVFADADDYSQYLQSDDEDYS